ncbi:hypothetical protein KAR48_20200 [bacterium]|nr:hypothetical protein [bacterium]
MKKILISLSVLIALMMILSCTVKDPVAGIDPILRLSDAYSPGVLYLESDQPYPFSVLLVDDDSNNFTGAVSWTIFSVDFSNEILSGALLDNGLEYDLVADDSRYTGVLDIDDVDRIVSSYRIVFRAENINGIESDTISIEFELKAGELNSIPTIELLVFNAASMDTAYAGDSLEMILEVSDVQGHADIDTVLAGFYAPFAAVPDAQIVMLRQADPGKFKATWNVPELGGMWNLRFQAKDISGGLSIPKIHSVRVMVPDGPPVITEVIAPDTVSRATSQSFLLSAEVADPFGLQDILRVFFNTTKPDGSASSGNPFKLYDDGTQGDLTTGDGIFSLMITIGPGNATGNYQFEFNAEDRSGRLANPVVHTIIVVE